jgi:hypothetical protein
MARLGVLLDNNAAKRRWCYGMNGFEAYIREVLSHAGIPFQLIKDVRQISNDAHDIVLVALAEENEQIASSIRNFAEQGGPAAF